MTAVRGWGRLQPAAGFSPPNPVVVLALLCAIPAAFGQTGQAAAHAKAVTVTAKESSYLGIGVEDVNSDRARNLKLKEERGAYVTSVMPDTPAAKAGIKEGDVILEYNGQRVEGQQQLIHMVRETAAGKTARISLWRNGAPVMVTAIVGSHKVMEAEDGGFTFEMPPMPNLTNPSLELNMPMIDIPKMLTVMQNRTLGIEGESLAQEPQFAEFFGVKGGVLVKSVSKGSAAERAGVKAGDVIAKLGDTKVSSWRDVATALRYAQPGRTVAMVVVRNRKEMPLNVTIDDRQ